MKILVADDSRTLLLKIEVSLKKLGHTVISTTNAKDAIELFKQEHPDLIILDVVMEGMNGFECASRIRALSKDDWIPIIFLSGIVDDENILKGINSGGDDYLCKPYSEITLAAKIKAMQRIADMRQKLFETARKLASLSSTDTLTGIANRLQFDRTMKERMMRTKRYKKMMALLFIDLDHFKSVNDSLGHLIGDALLQEVAKRLTSCIRLDDFIARLGGDEFAIIINEVEDVRDVDEVAKKILSTINTPYILDGNEVNISCSIGIECYTSKEAMSIETFIQNADIAMYHAKESGRNIYQFFNEKLNKKYHEQIDLGTALRSAVESQKLVLLYQPVFNLNTKEIIRMEALISWSHPRFGRVSPSIFVPLAEEMGLMDRLGAWIIENACIQGAKWFATGFHFKLSINMTPKQLLQKNLQKFVTSILKDTHIPMNQLELELTETSPLIYSDIYKNVLNNIHEAGISICLDDFGKTYSSLTHLQRLPISAIKIDKTFITDVTININDAMLVKSVIILGGNLGFDVIVEGIETKEQLEFLIENGCIQGQGYYLCKPKNAEEMTRFLHQKMISTTRVKEKK